MSELILVSHSLCPYVQRAAIALAEKSVPFERRVIDLANKPDWFKAISPLSKVPLLILNQGARQQVLFESAAILEYLEETQPNPLHPADPVLRAQHRAWMEFGSAVLNGIARFYAAPDQVVLDKEAEGLAALFARVEEQLGTRPDGEWFAGPRFSLVDAVFGPVFRYFDAFDRIGDFGVLAGKPRVAAWRRSLAARPSVASAVSPEYPAPLLAFLRQRRSRLSEIIPAAHLGPERLLEPRPAQRVEQHA